MITHPLIYCDWLEEQGWNVVLLREDLESYSRQNRMFDTHSCTDDNCDSGWGSSDYNSGDGCGYGMLHGNGRGYGYELGGYSGGYNGDGASK